MTLSAVKKVISKSKIRMKWRKKQGLQKKYRIMDVLGQGTFGQVAKCMNIKTREAVAVKVIKNKPAYHSQSLMEVAILELLNSTFDPGDVHHFVRMTDHFMHQNHLCIVFEMLSVNLYELLKQNQFRGLSTNLVRIFVRQILDSLIVLNKARIIHCDLKPENILLKNLDSPNIKVIDFGSACHENQTVYTYIQSRFYRSPEVVLGLPYTSSIDMWSLGCIAGELFLGLPLFPGSSEYNLISRITEMMGLPPIYMCEKGKSARAFFQKSTSVDGRIYYSLKPPEQFMQESGTTEQPSKRYFSGNTLSEVIGSYPIAKKGASPEDLAKENRNRTCFIDFLHGLLKLNPFERWTPQQARMHPFITGEAYTGPYIPQAARIGPVYPPGLGPADQNPEYRDPPKRRPRANTSGSLHETLPPQLQRLAAAQKRDVPTFASDIKPMVVAPGSVYHSPVEHSVEPLPYQPDGVRTAAPEGMTTPRNVDSRNSTASQSVSVSDSQYVSARQSTMSSVSSRSFGDELAYDGMRPPSGARGPDTTGRAFTPLSSPYSTLAPPSAGARNGSPGVRRGGQVVSRKPPPGQDDGHPLAGSVSIPERLDTMRGIAHVTQQVGDIRMNPVADSHPMSTVTHQHHVQYGDAPGAGDGRYHEQPSDTRLAAGYPLRKARSETVFDAPAGPEQRLGHYAAAHMGLLPRDHAFSQSQQLAYAEDALAVGLGQGHPRHGETGERSAVPSRRASIYSSVEWEPFGDGDRGPGGSGPNSQTGSRRGSIQNEANRPLHSVHAPHVYPGSEVTGLQDPALYSNNLQHTVKAPSMPELMRQDNLQRGLAPRLTAGYPTSNTHYAAQAHYSVPPPPAPVPHPQAPSHQSHPPPLGYRRGSAIAINMTGYEAPPSAAHYTAVPYPGPVTAPYEWGYSQPIEARHGQPYVPPPPMHQHPPSLQQPYQGQPLYQQHQHQHQHQHQQQQQQQHPHHHHQQPASHDLRTEGFHPHTSTSTLAAPPQHTQYAPPLYTAASPPSPQEHWSRDASASGGEPS
ncbi:dual specificity protein kinase yak1 [Geranomyces michiganensis]|nr:dual specificity protein kinase yak1 [Geranomyces michiganensis]